MIDDIREDVAWFNKISESTLAGRLGIEFVQMSRERLVATMPVAGNIQLHNILHGGASVVLAESLGSVGATLHAGKDRIALGIDVNATHHRPARGGVVTGVATPLYLGDSAATYQIAITGEDGALVCTARITCAIRNLRNRRRSGNGNC